MKWEGLGVGPRWTHERVIDRWEQWSRNPAMTEPESGHPVVCARYDTRNMPTLIYYRADWRPPGCEVPPVDVWVNRGRNFRSKWA